MLKRIKRVKQMDFVKSVEDLKDKDGEVYASNVEVFTTPDVPFLPSDALKAAIANGAVSTSARTVEVTSKNADGDIVKAFRQTYTKCVAKSKAGALALPSIDGDEEKLWNFVSQRADGADYQNIYVPLKNAAAGPEAAVKKFAKFTAGLTPEQLAAVKASLGL